MRFYISGSIFLCQLPGWPLPTHQPTQGNHRPPTGMGSFYLVTLICPSLDFSSSAGFLSSLISAYSKLPDHDWRIEFLPLGVWTGCWKYFLQCMIGLWRTKGLWLKRFFCLWTHHVLQMILYCLLINKFHAQILKENLGCIQATARAPAAHSFPAPKGFASPHSASSPGHIHP